jgi:hypothetical protein
MTNVVSAEPDLKPPQPRSIPRWLDLTGRILGFVIALTLAAVSAAYEAFLTPLYWGSTRLPVSLVAALVGNIALVYFTYVVTGRRLATVGPAVVWVVVMVAAASRTSEGDLVLTDNNWVGIGTMLVGSVAFAVAGYRLILTTVGPRAKPREPVEDENEQQSRPDSGAAGSDEVESKA